MTRAPAASKILVETDRVRVTRYDFAPGAETGWHVHGHDYVITTLTPCVLVLEEPGGGTREVVLEAGIAYSRDAGVEHNVINGSDGPIAFVETELK